VADGFSLTKWYLDCVGEDGDTFVAYAALLCWGPLTLRYASTLRRRPGQPEAAVRTTLQEVARPSDGGEEITWGVAELGVEGRWTALDRPLEARVLESAQGDVHWRCVQPRARAVVVHDGARIEGLGYAEVLTITLPPWRLPIDELRWGRFLGERHALVWIDWRGEHTRRLSWLDGGPLQVERVEPEEVVSHDGRTRLSIEPGGLLRRGALGRTALAVVPAIDRLVPVRLLAADETKWSARGALEIDGRPADRGWVVHEVVRWPGR